MTSRLRQWPAAAWAAWAEWTSKSERSFCCVRRAGASLRPFFIGCHVVEHPLGVVELGGLLRGRLRRVLVAAGSQQQQDTYDVFLHLGKVPLCSSIKKGPPRRTALSLNALSLTLTCSRRRPGRCRQRCRRSRRHCRQR